MARIYRPIDVLDFQVELVRWWSRSIFRFDHGEAFQPVIDQAGWRGGTGKRVPVHAYLHYRLDSAETIYVRRPIVETLWDFAEKWATHEHELVLPDDAPMDCGFAYLEKPVYIRDFRGQRLSIRAILWSAETNGYSVTTFSDRDDPLDDVNREMDEKVGREYRLQIDCPLPISHMTGWTYGHNVRDLDPNQVQPVREPGNESDAMWQANKVMATQQQAHMHRFILALWEFMGEQMPYKQFPDRFMAKRLKRAHSPLKEVSVIDLRPWPQDHPHNPNPQTVLWTHRWRQREHKRRWIDKAGNHRETTVSACVKGPDHLPLIEKDRVFHVKR
jgi:hypothetical protein